MDRSQMPEGLDLVIFVPDFTKSWEENWKEYREKYYKVYGEYPPDPKEPREKPESTN